MFLRRCAPILGLRMVAYPRFLKPAEEFLKLLRPELCKMLQAKFRELRQETVRKGVRVTLRASIWPVYRGQIDPFGSFWVPCGPAFRVPPGLFGQFLRSTLAIWLRGRWHRSRVPWVLHRLFAGRCARATREKSPYLLGAQTAHDER